MKRIYVDLIIAISVILLFGLHYYDAVPAPLQLVALKALLVSFGVLHAHIARKLIFPIVNWKTTQPSINAYAALSFYIVIPICYAFGG